MVTAAEAWERFAEKANPRRAVNSAGATTWLNWTQYPDHGPDESVLGEVGGKRVLELGSGSGCNLAHLATLGARCVGVDIAPGRAVVAARRWGHLPGLEFVTTDAVDYLAGATSMFDVVYSIFGAVWFTDPAILLPLVRKRMSPGGVFAFSQVPDAEPRPGRLITKWNYTAEQLITAGFAEVTAEHIPAPASGKPGTVLVRGSVRQ